MEVLFTFLADRYEQSSIMITSNFAVLKMGDPAPPPLNAKKPKKDLPAIGKLIERASKAEIFNEVDEVFGKGHKLSRNLKLYLCKKYTAERLATIGKQFSISDSAVSHVCNRTKKKVDRERQTKLKVDKIVKKLKLSIFKT